MKYPEMDARKSQDRQMSRLQNQIGSIEQQMNEHAELRRKIEELGELQTARTEKAYERVKSQNRLLQDEIEKRYGTDDTPAVSGTNSRLLQQVMSLRTEEFQKSQAKKAHQIQHLAAERQRIMDARSRLREKQDMLRSLPSPVGSDISDIDITSPSTRTPAYRSVHSSDSNVRKAARDMPATLGKIWNIRERIQQDYFEKRAPYNGENGIGSYEKWQLPDYFMVRSILEEFVDDFIVKHVPPDYDIFEREMRMHMAEAKGKDWHTTSKALSERKAVTLLAEEILLQVTREQTREVAMEMHQTHNVYRRLATNTFIKESEVQGTGNPEGRDPHDPMYDLLTRAFNTLQKDRDQHKKGVWAHSQVMSHPVVPPPQPLRRNAAPSPPPVDKKKKPAPKETAPKPRQVAEEEPIDADVTVIRHDHLIPENLKSTEYVKVDSRAERNRKFWTDVYKKHEVNYWKSLAAFMFNVQLAKRGQGVSQLKVSPEHALLAVGMKSGDVLVLNTWVEPWPVVKFDLGQGGQGSVEHLAWSLDSSQLLAVHKSGTISVWNVNGQAALGQAVKAIDSQAVNLRKSVFALARVMTLDARKGDFDLKQGILANQGSGPSDSTPVIGHFFPSLSYLMTQPSICMGVKSGEMLKFNVDANQSDNLPILFKPSVTRDGEEDLTKSNLSVDLLQQHKVPIIHLGCIGNLGKLVSVDEKGFINLWKHDKEHMQEAGEHVTEFGWFFPDKKYKLDMNKTMYSPSSTERARVIFTDRNRSKGTSKTHLGHERRRAQESLDGIQLGDPWHVALDQRGLESSIYIPPGISKDSGALFNIVIRYIKTRQLSTYMTRMYRPEKLPCTRLMSVRQSPSGNQLVFVLLFPQFPPKDAHLMILVLDLPSVKLRNFRQDIPVTEQQFKDLSQGQLFSADISQTYGPTGSDYLFLTVCGQFSCLSLTTGNKMLLMDNMSRPRAVGFKGLVIDEKQFPQTRNQKVSFVGNMGSLYAVLYDQNSTNLKVMRLEDRNTYEDARNVWKARQQWESFTPTLPELRINPISWTLPDMKHKYAEMRSIILSLVFHATGSQEEKEQEKRGHYEALRQEVMAEDLLNRF